MANFMSLPTELRLMIYCNLKESKAGFGHPKTTARYQHNPHPQVLGVCRSVREEAKSIFYNGNKCSLHIPEWCHPSFHQRTFPRRIEVMTLVQHLHLRFLLLDGSSLHNDNRHFQRMVEPIFSALPSLHNLRFLTISWGGKWRSWAEAGLTRNLQSEWCTAWNKEDTAVHMADLMSRFDTVIALRQKDIQGRRA